MRASRFPFSINEFYSEEEIVRALGIGARGGIRLSKKNNIIVLFFKAHNTRPSSDGGRNIYHDKFDYTTGFYYYTGTGQTGDQSFDNSRNRWLRYAYKDGRQIHLFRQYEQRGEHEYLGSFEVSSFDSKVKQVDAVGNLRNVIVFKLLPLTSALSNLAPAKPTEKRKTRRNDKTGAGHVQNITPIRTIAEKSLLAEQMVLEYEKSLGRDAKSVSLTTVGYDIESRSKKDPSDRNYSNIQIDTKIL